MVSRETVHRHRSERLIDRFLLRAEKSRTEELQQRLAQLEKRQNFAANIKRRKQEEEQKESQAKERERQQKEALRSKFQQLDAEGALVRILKHLHSPKKFSKCLSMLCKLVDDQFDFLSGDSLFTAFDSVMKYKARFNSESDRTQIETFYFKLIELSSQTQEYDNEALFSERQTAILDLYYDCVYIQQSSYSDDAFKLNDALKQLQAMLPIMPRYCERHDVNMAYFTQLPKLETSAIAKPSDKHEAAMANQNEAEKVPAPDIGKTTLVSCYNFDTEEAFIDYLAGMRRWIYLDTLKLMQRVFESSRGFVTSRTAFIQTLRASYLAKEKFSEDEAESLAEMINSIRNQSAASQKARDVQSRMDDRIKADLIQGTETAVDSRAEKIVKETGTERWASRQSNL